MPVLPYHSQKEAPSETVIWRFLDLRKFRDLMANQELYFRRADLFDDQSEGLPPEGSCPKSVITSQPVAAAGRSSDRWLR
jgi:hypothetical protein